MFRGKNPVGFSNPQPKAGMTPSNSLGMTPLDEENEYWLKRYGHKRWFPKYVDQSGAPGRAEGWVWLEGLEGLDTTCPKNPTGNDGTFFQPFFFSFEQWKTTLLV